jgi:hypothetical protein
MKIYPPILLERVCDAGRSGMTAEEILLYSAELNQRYGESFMLSHPYAPGCGIRFQWYFGMIAHCPECGRAYETRMEDFKAGKYNPTI